MCPKSQKMKLQKHYLEVSNSSRKEVRAFFRFTAERKNYEFFQMSQKKRLEILRCVVLLNFFSKKRSLKQKQLRSDQRGPPFGRKKSRRKFPAVFHGRAAFLPQLCRFCPHLARQRMATFLPPSVLNAVLLDALNINSY
jgi:hypothetical protein